MNLIKKNLEHLRTFWNYIAEHLLCIIALILVFIVSFIVLKQFPYSMPIWFTAIGLIVTAFWSIYQFTKNKISKQQEKASEIAQDFANNLIEKMGIISDVLLANQEFKDDKMYYKIKRIKSIYCS